MVQQAANMSKSLHAKQFMIGEDGYTTEKWQRRTLKMPPPPKGEGNLLYKATVFEGSKCSFSGVHLSSTV